MCIYDSRYWAALRGMGGLQPLRQLGDLGSI